MVSNSDRLEFVAFQDMASVRSTVKEMEDKGLSVSKVDDTGIWFILSVFEIPNFKLSSFVNDYSEANEYWETYSLSKRSVASV